MVEEFNGHAEPSVDSLLRLSVSMWCSVAGYRWRIGHTFGLTTRNLKRELRTRSTTCHWVQAPLLRFVVDLLLHATCCTTNCTSTNLEQIERLQLIHVKMLYSLSYDLLSDKSTANQSSGVWA